MNYVVHQHFVTNKRETTGITMSLLAFLPPQIKMAKSEADAQWLRLRSLQYLERYIYLILFNCYLHLEKKDSWRRSFSQWMYQVKPDSLAYFRKRNISHITQADFHAYLIECILIDTANTFFLNCEITKINFFFIWNFFFF